MHYSDDLAGEISLAWRFAVRGLELDPIDPFVNFTMGRTFWLEGDLESRNHRVIQRIDGAEAHREIDIPAAVKAASRQGFGPGVHRSLAHSSG